MTATDPLGNTSGFSQVLRSNAAPSLDGTDLNLVAAGVTPTVAITQPNPKATNQFRVTGSVPDADLQNTYSAIIDWGDGEITTIPLPPSTIAAGSRAVLGQSHVPDRRGHHVHSDRAGRLDRHARRPGRSA